jgi:hypothetical protein
MFYKLHSFWGLKALSRFLIILAIIIGAGYFIRLWFRKKIKSFISQAKDASTQEKPKDKEVIYSRDDIVVLKGEAKKKNENE